MPSPFIIFQHIAPQHLFSRIVGRAAESKLFRKPFISWFKKRYQVDLSEALIEDPFEFENFNAFFTRALKSGARAVCKDPGAIVSPADGAISQLGAIEELSILQAKGRHYSVKSLLACSPDEAKDFVNGSFATIYLSPRDYHRVHMPIAGKLRKTTYVPGKLFSVNQKTAASVADLFARNERLVCYFDTAIGPMALILVGAMIVAGIETVWSGAVAPNANKTIVNEEGFDSVRLKVGEEMGRFKLGSTAILLFQENAISLSPQLKAGSAIRMGESIATQKIEEMTNDTR